MKTAISIPDKVFRDAERFAKRTRKSRSQLYTEAIAEYLARRAPDAVTEAMNAVCDRAGTTLDRLIDRAAVEVLRSDPW